MQPLNYILVILKRNFFLAQKLNILTYYNLTREERQTMYNLKNDQSIVIKEADKGSAVVIWDKKEVEKPYGRITLWKQNYLMEAQKQLSCKEIYEEFSSFLFSLNLFMIPSEKFEEEDIFLVIF